MRCHLSLAAGVTRDDTMLFVDSDRRDGQRQTSNEQRWCLHCTAHKHLEEESPLDCSSSRSVQQDF